jgi:hypothetical protein
MKLYNKIAGLILVSTVFFSSCTDIVPEKSTHQWTTTHTIDALIKNYVSKAGVLPTRTPSLFSVDTIPSNKSIVINGIVVSNDNEGNIYKYLVIQDVNTGTALKVSIDAGNLSAIFPTGRAITIDCSGLAIGKYAEMLQMGMPFYNTTSGKVGYEIGRIPYTLFMNRVQVNKSTFSPLSEYVDTVTISQILTGGTSMHGKLVCIKNAFFTGKGADYGKPLAIVDALKIFAPTTNGVGFPQSREIQDGTGSVFIATSEYSKFATRRLPDATMKGNITAIVGYYNDKDATIDPSKIYHQLTLRALSDLGTGFERYHQVAP